MTVRGVILAGGQNTRYGAHKALATVGGERIVERVLAALEAVTPEVVLVANEPEVYAGLGLPMRGDVLPGLGALGGIHAALEWAREDGRDGVLVLACDMPFAPVPLLRALMDAAAAPAAPDIVAPESGGRRGVEPLCAFYATRCLDAVEAALARDDRRVVGFWDDVAVERIPLEVVRTFGEPDRLFMNVNTPEERERAERLVQEAPRG